MMRTEQINLKNFDEAFSELLKNKHAKNVVKGRFDLESLDFELRVKFAVEMIKSHIDILAITYKISFWEDEVQLTGILEGKQYRIINTYKNGELPGVIFIEDSSMDTLLLKILLTNHFNFEMAKEPAINMRLQICISNEVNSILYDIYDDRGFDVYY